MSKLAVLKLGEGSFSSGFTVILQIGEAGEHPATEIVGSLPAAPELLSAYQRWQSSYCHLGLPSRLEAPAEQVKNVSLIEDCYLAGEELAGHLNTWLRAERFRAIREKFLEKLHPSQEIRLILQVQEFQLQQLPWHLWELLDRYPKLEIAFSAPVYDRSISRLPLSSARSHVKLLAVLGDSNGIDTKADQQLLEQLPDADINFLIEPSRQSLHDTLWTEGWHILFFAGHSLCQAQGNRGRIFLNPSDSLSMKQLKYALRKAVEQGLQLAIFNSCEGLGLARELAELQIPQIIVMREPVPDQVAQEFLKNFLVAFSSGLPLYLAVREARERLQGLEERFPCASWLPTIVQNPAELPPTWQKLTEQGFTSKQLVETDLENRAADASTQSELGSSTLAAIVFTDVESFTSKMAANESQTLSLLERDFQLMRQICQQFEGQVLKSLGDGLLIYFVSAEKAVSCTVAMQQALASQQPTARLKHRMGIHLGEVWFRGDDVMGNGVNLAARLQGEAPAGGICISQTVYEVIKNRLSLPIVPQGTQQLKGIPDPVAIYHITLPPVLEETEPAHPDSPQRWFSSLHHFIQQLPSLVLISLLSTTIVLGLRALGWLQPLELKLYDHLLQVRPDPDSTPDPRLLVVTITDADIQAQKQRQEGLRGTSLSDRTLARLLQTLNQAQPRVIGLDLYRDFALEPAQTDLLVQLRQTGNLVGVCKASDTQIDPYGISPPAGIPREQLGFSDFLSDGDGVVRRHLLWMNPEPTSPCPAPFAFSTEIAFRYLEQQGFSFKFTPAGHLQIQNVLFKSLPASAGGYQRFNQGGGQVLLNYRSPTQVADQVTLTQVLTSQVNPQAIKNRIVLIGTAAKSSSDQWSTPYSRSEKTPGVIVQAQMVSHLLSTVLDDRPLLWVWAPWLESIWIAAWSGVGVVLAYGLQTWRFSRRNRFVSWSLGFVVVLISLYSSCFSMFTQSGWIPLLPPALALGLSSGSLVIYHQLAKRRV